MKLFLLLSSLVLFSFAYSFRPTPPQSLPRREGLKNYRALAPPYGLPCTHKSEDIEKKTKLAHFYPNSMNRYSDARLKKKKSNYSKA
ncbi:MAG: hypothetical protein LH609_01380 [Rudanella sp.]|nr:hypothetical protein [Rudanella sp.]